MRNVGIGIAGTAIVALVLLALSTTAVPDPRTTQDWISTALMRLQSGEFLPLSHVVDADDACVLPPYGMRIGFRPDLDAIVNRHLAERNFQGDEGHWYLILRRGESVDVLELARGRGYDLASPFEIERRRTLIPGLVTANCLPVGEAGFLRTGQGIALVRRTDR